MAWRNWEWTLMLRKGCRMELGIWKHHWQGKHESLKHKSLNKTSMLQASKASTPSKPQHKTSNIIINVIIMKGSNTNQKKAQNIKTTKHIIGKMHSRSNITKIF
jgi:hypothetical protein